MPWTCCGDALVDSDLICPKCGKAKAAWTVKLRKTRVLQVASRFDTGVEEEEPPEFEDDSLADEPPEFEDDAEDDQPPEFETDAVAREPTSSGS